MEPPAMRAAERWRWRARRIRRRRSGGESRARGVGGSSERDGPAAGRRDGTPMTAHGEPRIATGGKRNRPPGSASAGKRRAPRPPRPVSRRSRPAPSPAWGVCRSGSGTHREQVGPPSLASRGDRCCEASDEKRLSGARVRVRAGRWWRMKGEEVEKTCGGCFVGGRAQAPAEVRAAAAAAGLRNTGAFICEMVTMPYSASISHSLTLSLSLARGAATLPWPLWLHRRPLPLPPSPPPPAARSS
jgi:hypothetical protein